MTKFLVIFVLLMVLMPVGCNLILPMQAGDDGPVGSGGIRQEGNFIANARMVAAGFNLTLSYFLPLHNSRSIN